MCRKKVLFVKAKRAAGTGLFLGVLLGLGACTEPAVHPGVINTPVPVVTEGPILSQVPDTPTPEPTKVPVPTATSVPGGSPAATATAMPTLRPTPTPESVPIPVITVTPLPSATPEPSVTPESTVPPEAEVTPEATPGPELTRQPEYETLMQNGWQRTEDFFGYREIFFSGKLDRTELSTAPGRYEYQYTASSDAGIFFSIIGEEGVSVQQFLDELTQTVPDCLTEREAEEDYRYTYTEEAFLVTGRIYACGTAENVRRMRVEFRQPATGDVMTEGYEFYLK